MRRRDLIVTSMAAACGFAVAAFVIGFIVTSGDSVREQGNARIGGPFALVDDTGAAVTESTLAGRPSAIYFGYTFCPEVCPTTLLDMSRWIQKLGPDADKLNFVFVSIDPARDTSALMHTYLSSFDKHIRGFTGTAGAGRPDRPGISRLLQTDSDRRRRLRDGPFCHHLFDGGGRQACWHDRLSGRRYIGARQAEKSGGHGDTVVLKRAASPTFVDVDSFAALIERALLVVVQISHTEANSSRSNK